MTSTTIPVLDAVPAPAGEQATAAPPAAPVAGCTVLTLAVLTVAVTDPGHPVWAATAAALAAVAVAWGGRPAFAAAGAALRRGGLTADSPVAAGLLTLLGAAVAAGPGAAAAAAAVATVHAAAPAVQDRLAPASTGDGPPDRTDAVARARRGAVVLERTADRAARGFAALLVVAAVATLGYHLGTGSGAATALGAAAAVLLACCPRAVGCATATALVTGVAQAARLGGVLDTPRTAEVLSRVDTVVLCRTGTLTSGNRSLRAVHVADGVDADEALRIAGAVAAAGREVGGAAGRHPVGALLADAARDRFGELPGVAEYDGYPGLGVRGIVTELCLGAGDEPRAIAHAALVGRVALLAAHGIALPGELSAAVAAVHAAGATAVAVSWDGTARAVLEVTDPLRPGAAEATAALRGLGLTTVLLTGDDSGAAAGLAAALGLDEVRAPLAAADRGAAVARLRAAGRTVAVLGGPADHGPLAAADVALARPGASPGERPGVVAVDDDPLTAVDALRATRATLRTVERTLTGAVAYHLVVLPAAVAGLLPPLAAAVAAAAFPAGALLYAAAPRRVRALPRPSVADGS